MVGLIKNKKIEVIKEYQNDNFVVKNLIQRMAKKLPHLKTTNFINNRM